MKAEKSEGKTTKRSAKDLTPKKRIVGGETREVVMVAITAWMAAIKHDTVKATIANIR